MADKKGVSGREAALSIILEVMEEGKHSHIAINQKLNSLKESAGKENSNNIDTLNEHPNTEIPYNELNKRERSAISKISLGTIENCIAIDYEIEKYSKIKVKKMKPVVRNLLRMSVYQMCYLTNIPDFAVCDEAVKIIKKRKLFGLEGFVNAVLRNIARNKDKYLVLPDDINEIQKLGIRYSMPEWIIEEWNERFGIIKTEEILKTFLEEKPLAVRLNLSRTSKDEILGLLNHENVGITESDIFDDMLYLHDFDSIDRLESFQKGFYQVQDLSSALAVRAAGIKLGDYIIDICAAPGGKALHAADILLRNELPGFVSARDLMESKIKLMKKSINRCGFDNIEIIKADALSLRSEDLGKADIVIADLPCSGLGIIGRKPDIKYKMNKSRQKELAALQQDILKISSQYVKTGGILMYSTCTINFDENENNYNFIINELGYEADSLNPYIPDELHSDTTEKGYLQIIPDASGFDGFFISRAKKR